MAPTGAAPSSVVHRGLPARQARTCYDHLAGPAGVDGLDHLVFNRWLVRSSVEDARPAYELTATGQASLASLGVDSRSPGTRRLDPTGDLDAWLNRI